MSLRGQQPMGVGAYARGQQPKNAPGEYVPPISDEGAPPDQRTSGKRMTFLIIVVGLIVVTGVIAALNLFVTVEYSQGIRLSLDSADNWNVSVCVPYPAYGSSTNVTFAWRTGGTFPVRLMLVPWDYQSRDSTPIYNEVATNGSGWFLSNYNAYVMGFVVAGTPPPSTAVNITLSYQMQGHFLGGPSEGEGCV